MAIFGAIVGVLVGFAAGIVFTEWVFANNASWPDVVPIALAVLGGLAGHQLGRRSRLHRAGGTRSA